MLQVAREFNVSIDRKSSTLAFVTLENGVSIIRVDGVDVSQRAHDPWAINQLLARACLVHATDAAKTRRGLGWLYSSRPHRAHRIKDFYCALNIRSVIIRVCILSYREYSTR